MYRSAVIIVIALLLPAIVAAEVLTEDTVWSGEVLVTEDVLVPAGVTLAVLPGTVVRVQPADSTKTDPEYASHRTEITIRGVLKVQGQPGAQVLFSLAESNKDQLLESWAGIIIDGGKADLTNSAITGAETALTVTHGTLAADKIAVSENRYGLIIIGADSSVTLANSRVEKNDYGIFLLNGGRLTRHDSTIAGNSKKDEFAADPPPSFPTRSYSFAEKITSQVYRDEALPGVTVWQGRILVDGQVRIPPEAELLIMPGTIVEFSRKDTNNDGIGENGLMIQGRFIAKGTSELPIIFRSAEPERAMGDWDSINILGSDQVQNLIEFCQIQDAYRGMHFHFANVAVTHSVLTNNYRGAQFQESLVLMHRNMFFANKSGVQARDSEVVFSGNEVIGNQNGANFFRLDLEATHNIFANNEQDGLRVREGASRIEGNMLVGNRFGFLLADANYSEIQGNFFGKNLEAGLALRNSDHVKVSSNAIQGNGINGIIIRDSRGLISGNTIADNGERGIAIVSYSGEISGNNIFGNGLYGIGLEGAADIAAQNNWWDDSDLDREIYDGTDETGLGTVHFKPQGRNPFPLAWAWPEIPVDTVWGGIVEVRQNVTVSSGASLRVRPGTTVRFGEGKGMEVLGTIKSEGSIDKRITYTALSDKGKPGYWGEVSLQQAGESIIANADFSYATWGVHSHFTPLTVHGCSFTENYGGVRFRSGPLEISGSVFMGNKIGIRSYRGVGRIRRNDITENEIGIFVREKGAGLAIEYNNIHANERYGLRLGDFNRQDVNAGNNWWGGEDPAKVIFDRDDESYIGKVYFEPVLPEPVDIIVQ